MSRTRRAVTGGIAVTVVTTVAALAPMMMDKWVAYRLKVEAMRLSAAQHKVIKACGDAGGRWWKGNCLFGEMTE